MSREILKSLSVLALVVAVIGLAGACSTESPTAPNQGASGPVTFPPPPEPEGAEVAFSCEAAPPGADPAGRLTISFINESTEEFVQFLWDFGDGSTSRQESPAHTYRTGAQSSFLVTLTGEAAFGSKLARSFVPESCEQFEEEPPEEP